MTENVTRSCGLLIILPRSTYRAVSDVDESQMAAKDSKIHVTRSVIDDDDPTFDGKDTNNFFQGVHSSLARNKHEVIKQKTASLAMQTQLNGMAGQLE